MWHTFRYTLISLVQEKSVIVWVIIFPIVLSTLFAAMFSNIESAAFRLDPASCAVVRDEAYGNPDNVAFSQMVEMLDEEGDSRLLDVTYVDSVADARSLVADGNVLGYYVLDSEGAPSLTVSPVSDSNSMDAIEQTVLADIASEYIHARATFASIARTDPAALANAGVVQSITDRTDYTQQVSVTANPSAQSVRYFYALLGFAALMAAMIALQAVVRTQPNLSAVGARRTVSGISRSRTLGGALLASWVLSFGCLVLAFAYMRFALGIGFGGRDAACLLGLFVASLMTTAFGACIGAIPKLAEGAKGGILTGITCMLSLFAGLYGTPSLSLADQVARIAPWLATANPVKKVADLFYSLYFYTSYEPFFADIVILLVLAGMFGVVAAVFMRRQRYASL
jgi:hypothetical protein